VLLVEDEESVRRLFSTVLESSGYRVLPAAAPHEALAMARNHDGPLDLVITDVIMPDMDGRSVAAAVLALHPGCRVLLISGYPSDSAEVGGDIGDAAFLQKPFTPRTLVARVREMLQSE
jgi:two-component system cell cycle sensor histidine kinase/response regulator CckA